LIKLRVNRLNDELKIESNNFYLNTLNDICLRIKNRNKDQNQF